MIRHRSTTAALVLASVLTPFAQAFAQTTSPLGPSSVQWRRALQQTHEAARGGKQVASSAPYLVTYLSKQETLRKTFSELSQALAFGKNQKDTIILDENTGSIVYTTIQNPYEVIAQPGSGSSASSPGATTSQPVYYKTASQAIAAAAANSNQVVVDRLTGAIIWSNGNNYQVSGPSGQASYQTYSSALAAARAQMTASVAAGSTGGVLWKANYRVVTGGQFAQSFATFTNAQAYAQQNSSSEVINIATGKDVWNNIPQFDVYQNGILIKQFTSQAPAVQFAQTLTDVTVVQISDQKTVYSNVPSYVVEVGARIIKSFVLEASAIAYAKTQSGSVVIQISNNQVVWSSGGAYGVYQYLKLVRTFDSLPAAISFAKTQTDVQVIDTATNAVDYSNYPATVKSPYGDTFTVANGMVVDRWGKTNYVLAPAPSFMTPGQTYVSNDYTHWYEVQPSGDVYVGQWVNPYQTMNLESPSTLTAAQINAFFAANASPSSVLQNSGQYFIEAQQTYGVNAQYLVAHAIIESAWGTSYFAENRNNLFGYMAYTSNPNAAATFRSVEYDINFQGWFVRNSYLDANGPFYNGPNLDGMNVDYATDPYWANSIARIMSQIAPYSDALGNQPLLGEQATRKVFLYPTGATGQATVNATVYAAPADATTAAPMAIGSIAKGANFSVLGDCPGWDEVKLPSGQTGFVNWNDVSLQNMLAVTNINYGSTLAVNSVSNPTSTSDTIDKLTNGAYIVLLKAPGNGWDYIADSNGKVGWVSSKYVQAIH
ncbi:MAG: glucosaminidase domain-containing protein [Bacilli bacterium]